MKKRGAGKVIKIQNKCSWIVFTLFTLLSTATVWPVIVFSLGSVLVLQTPQLKFPASNPIFSTLIHLEISEWTLHSFSAAGLFQTCQPWLVPVPVLTIRSISVAVGERPTKRPRMPGCPSLRTTPSASSHCWRTGRGVRPQDHRRTTAWIRTVLGTRYVVHFTHPVFPLKYGISNVTLWTPWQRNLCSVLHYHCFMILITL